MHGLAAGSEQFDETPYAALVDGLRDQGWQVILVEYPEDHAADPIEDLRRRFADPEAYRAESVEHVRKLIDAGSGPVLLGGISWGGWHTFSAAHLPGVTGWFVHAPVTRISVLEEFADIDTTSIDASDLRAVSAPGFVRWGTDDDRVNGALAQSVAGSSGGPVDVGSVDRGHETTDADVRSILEWTGDLISDA